MYGYCCYAYISLADLAYTLQIVTCRSICREPALVPSRKLLHQLPKPTSS
uniref:Uncharacterized protein n=1 Tax=Anguilla anguilla TaxID=7936 RepID=A0A0E9TUG3_ANGAN